MTRILKAANVSNWNDDVIVVERLGADGEVIERLEYGYGEIFPLELDATYRFDGKSDESMEGGSYSPLHIHVVPTVDDGSHKR